MLTGALGRPPAGRGVPTEVLVPMTTFVVCSEPTRRRTVAAIPLATSEGARDAVNTQHAITSRDALPCMVDYAAERAAFDIRVPDSFNPVVDILESWAADAPDDLALVSLGPEGETVAEQSVADLVRAAEAFARVLADLGVRKGERVFVMLPRVPEWYTAVLGAIRLGVVPVPGPNLLTSGDIAYRITQSDAVIAVTDASGAAKIDAIGEQVPTLRHRICTAHAAPPLWLGLDEAMAAAGSTETELPAAPTRSEDPMLMYFTSGTVSHPKMVLHAQRYGLGHVGAARYWHDLRRGDRHWTVSDTGWAKAAYGGFFGQWHERATVVQVALAKPSADAVLGVLKRGRITSFCAPPTLYRTLVQAELRGDDYPALRHCTSAGEPLNPEVIDAWRRGMDLVIYDGYGQTETSIMVGNYRCVPVRPGSMGRPAPGWEVEVLDQADRPAAPGVVGNIAVKIDPDNPPLGFFAGYYRNEQATAETRRHGWYFTGDRAARDAEGYLWFEGRDDDVITSSAYRIGPFEVESALLEHPAVVEAAVVGKDDQSRTQVVCAFVILAADADRSDRLAVELQEHVKSTTAPYKYPREIHFVDELPKTISGKIRRSELRKRLRDG